MERVVTINLNGHAYQLDEGGYERLRTYLEHAAAQLRGNPDRVEILADLEQAIAEKCARHLGVHKSVVTAGEVDQIVKEMGPVHDPDARTDATQAEAADGGNGAKTTADEAPPKRLYQVREGAMLTGVCNGLAAYFNVDVTLVRVGFVILAVVTQGVWILVYLLLSLVVPYANTAEERAAARGLPFSAQELIDRAKRNYRDFRASGKWRRQRAQWRREWRRTFHGARGYAPVVIAPPPYATQVWAGVLAPVLALAQAALFVLLAVAVMSLVDDGDIFGWMPPPELPLWAAVVGLVLVYNIAASPFRAASAGLSRHRSGLAEASAGLFTLFFLAFFVWVAYENNAQVREFVQDLPDIWAALRDSFRR